MLNLGLTDAHPTLTTYFEGEMIGTKHSFRTQHPEWGSTEKTDMQHWAKFSAWRPLQKQAKRADFRLPNYAQRENVFMRWKEQFLVPDHTVRTISGASFEGFYYICFNQVAGTISGIYFHAKSEKSVIPNALLAVLATDYPTDSNNSTLPTWMTGDAMARWSFDDFCVEAGESAVGRLYEFTKRFTHPEGQIRSFIGDCSR